MILSPFSNITAAQANLKKVLKVTSVTGINAKQYQIVFSTPVVKSTVIASDNTLADGILTLKLAGNGTALTVDDNVATLSADGTTLTATLSGNQKLDGTYEFKLLKNKVQSTDAQTITADYTQALIVSDKVAPTVSSVAATAKTSTNVVNVTFSEPVQVTGAAAYVNGKAATVQAGSTLDKVVLTSVDVLEAGKTYSVSLLNFKDYNTNFTSPNPYATTVTISGDTTAPTVQSVSVVRDNLIEVTFDKAIDSNTLGTGIVKVLDANGTPQGGSINAQLKASATDNKTITVSLASAVPFNSNGVFTGSLVLPNTIKDTTGNALVATTQAITLTKDTVAPTVVSATYITPGSSYQGDTYPSGAVAIRFNEQIAKNGTPVSVDVKLIAPNGTVATSSLTLTFAGVVVRNDNTEIVIPGASALAAGNYSLILGNSVVKDLSTQANKNIAATTTVSVGTGSDTTKPTVTPGTATAATTQSTGTTIAVTMTDDIGLDLDSVRNTSNYLLDGAPLPAGSYITIFHNSPSTDAAATDVDVTVNIPAQSIAKNSTTAVLNVNNIVDKAGNYADPAVSSALTLADDISPALSTGTLSTSGTLALGFTETLGATPDLDTDLQFVINGTTVDTAANQYLATIAVGAGSDLNKYVVTYNGYVDAGTDGDADTTADNRLYLNTTATTAYDAATDILIKTGTTITPGAVTVVDANLFSSLNVVVPTGSTIVDTTSMATKNPIKIGTTILVK